MSEGKDEKGKNTRKEEDTKKESRSFRTPEDFLKWSEKELAKDPDNIDLSTLSIK